MRLVLILLASFGAAACQTINQSVCSDGEQQIVSRVLVYDGIPYPSEPVDQTCVAGQWVDGDDPVITPDDSRSPQHEGPAEEHLYYR